MVTLYTTTDDKRTIVKTVTQTTSYSTCDFKDRASILKPVVIIPYSSEALTSNYMYISDFDRYYYIDNISVLSAGRLEISGTVDPLMSFASQIRTLPVTVKRSSRDRTYMRDDSLPMLPYKSVKVIEFEGGDFNIENATALSCNYTLTVAGGGASE